MQVTVYKTVEIEAEADVLIEDVLIEFARRVDEAEPDYYRRLASALDWMTWILANVTDQTIAAFPDEGKAVMFDRLAKEASRWKV